MTPTRAIFIASTLAWSACDTEVHEERLEIADPVAVLAVDLGSGDVRIVGADVDRLTIVSKIEGRSNHLGQSLSEGRLSLFDDCNESPCGVDIEALIPANLPIEIYTGSGDIRLRDMRAEVLLDGSGDIDGKDVIGLGVDAETGSGDIDLRLIPPADRIDVQTGSGDVRLEVPSGSYRLGVSTGSGDEDVAGITSDAAAARSIDVDTGSGDVRIDGN